MSCMSLAVSTLCGWRKDSDTRVLQKPWTSLGSYLHDTIPQYPNKVTKHPHHVGVLGPFRASVGRRLASSRKPTPSSYRKVTELATTRAQTSVISYPGNNITSHSGFPLLKHAQQQKHNHQHKHVSITINMYNRTEHPKAYTTSNKHSVLACICTCTCACTCACTCVCMCACTCTLARTYVYVDI